MTTAPPRLACLMTAAALLAGCTVTGITHPEDRRADGRPLPHTLVRESPQEQPARSAPQPAEARARDAAAAYCEALGGGVAASSAQPIDAGAGRQERGVFGQGARAEVETARLFYACGAPNPTP